MRLFLFDLDGTLVMTGRAGSRALTRAFEQLHGVQRGFEGIEFAGRTDPVILRDALRRSLPGRFVGKREEDTAIRTILESYYPLLEHEVAHSAGYRILPGVVAVLKTIQEQVGRGEALLGLGTGNVARGARIKLERSRLNPFFPFGGFSDDAEERPELLRAAVRRAETRAGVGIRAGDVTVIGDTTYDVSAARSIGARAVAVATGPATPDTLRAAGADAVLPDLSDAGTRTALGVS